MRSPTPALAALLTLLLAPAAARPEEPKFTFTAPPKVEAVEWKAQSKAGLTLTSGNSHTTTFTFGANVSRKAAANKLALDAGLAYARSSILVAQDADLNGRIDPGELGRVEQTTANQWFATGRYDRFFTAHNSGYVAVLTSADRLAGKDLAVGGQVGYSRELFKGEHLEVVAEIGYDVRYEAYAAPVDSAATIHSGRVFLGLSAKVLDGTTTFANVDTLFNLNRVDRPDADHPSEDTGSLEDTRVVAKAGLTTTLWKALSFSFSFSFRYANNPAPLPQLKDAPPYAPGFMPFAERTDTITEAALIFSFT